MEKNKIFLSTLLVICVSLFAIGFLANISPNVSADDKTDKIKDKDLIEDLRLNDSVEILDDKTKTYTADEKKLKIEDKDEVLVELKLLTPYENKISSSGKDPIAKWQSIYHSDKWNLFDKMDSYKINDDYKVKDKNYYYQYLVETEITDCYEINETNNETGLNKTKEVCYDYIQEDWVEFSKAKDLPQGSIFGLFAHELVEGEHVEVLYGIEGFEIYEWASYLVTDLVAYYKMDEQDSGTGSIIDELGNNDGINAGGDNVTGKIIYGYDFDGNADKISIGANTDFAYGTGNFSISLWFKADDISDINMIFHQLDGSSVISAQIFLQNGLIYVFARDSGGSSKHSNTAFSDTTNWHHIVMTRTSGVIEGWLDGVSSGTTAGADKDITTHASSSIGERPDTGDNFDGKIDEVGIWSRALNSTEIEYLHANGTPGEAQQPPFEVVVTNCQFSGYIKDEESNALEGANITIWNQFNVTEYYEDTSDSNGLWAINVSNSTNTYMVGAYFNNSLIGQLKPYVSGTC